MGQKNKFLKIFIYHWGLDAGLPEVAVCRPNGVAYGLKRCIPDGNNAFGNRKSDVVLTDVGLGDPDELGVEEGGGGGGVICGRCGGGGPNKPGGKPLCIGDCHEAPL